MNKRDKKNFLALRVFTWTKQKEITSGQKMVQGTVLEWYEAKHRKCSAEEIIFINDNCSSTCPYCGSEKTQKNGFTSNGIQRFSCPNCHKRFNALTKTIFDSKKIPISEWIEYLLHLFEFHSIRSSSFDNRNAYSTGKYWLEKVFCVLKGIQNNVVLDETVFIDEAFFSVVKKNVIQINNKKLRGISRNKICVVTGRNKSSSFFFVTNVSKLNESESLKYYGSHIKEGSKIIHDLEKSHNIVVDKLHLKSESYDSQIIKKLNDEDNPLQPINEIHRLLKTFMSSHGGFNREELQDWLNLFWFITNGPKDRYEKVLLFIEKALKTRKRIKFRDFYAKND